MQMLIKEHSEYIFYVNSAMDYEGALAFARSTLLLKDLDLTRPKMFQIWRWSSCSKVLFLPGWTWTLLSWPGFHNQETQKYPFDILAYSTIIDSTSGRLFRRWSSVGQGCKGAGVHYMMTTRRRGVLHQKTLLSSWTWSAQSCYSMKYNWKSVIYYLITDIINHMFRITWY